MLLKNRLTAFIVITTIVSVQPLFAGSLWTPTGVAKEELTKVHGQGWAANATYNVQIMDPTGVVNTVVTSTDESGDFSVDVGLAHGGEYFIDLFDPASVIPVASTLIIAAE